MSEAEDAPDDSIAATQPENNMKNVGDRAFLDGAEDYNGEDYAMIPIPDEAEKPMFEWSKCERRAYMLREIMKHGHADNLPRSQRSYADDFDIAQPTLNYDIKRIRDYITATAGRRVISDTETVAQKAVKQLLEDGEMKKAWQVQREYTEWLFELGGDIGLERAPDKKQVQSVSVSADATEQLSDDQREQFDKLAEMINSDDDADEEIIDVEVKEDD